MSLQSRIGDFFSPVTQPVTHKIDEAKALFGALDRFIDSIPLLVESTERLLEAADRTRTAAQDAKDSLAAFLGQDAKP